MRTHRRLEALQLVLIAVMFAAAALLWASAPERLPVHWNLAGQADRYGGRAEGLLLMPAVTLGLYLLLAFIPRLAPRPSDVENFSRVYAIMRLAVVAYMAALYVMILLSAFGRPVDMGRSVPIGMGLLFVVLGNYMGKIRPNGFIGVRTPWTLASPEAWGKTNRLGGRLFVASGLAFLVLGAVGSPWTLALAIVTACLFCLGLPAYSYLVWRRTSGRAHGAP